MHTLYVATNCRKRKMYMYSDHTKKNVLEFLLQENSPDIIARLKVLVLVLECFEKYLVG